MEEIKGFAIPANISDSQKLKMENLKTIYENQNTEVCTAKMTESHKDVLGKITQAEYLVYFELPKGKNINLNLLQGLIKNYATTRRKNPNKFEYNFIGSIVKNEYSDEYTYSKVSFCKEGRDKIEELNQKRRRLRVTNKEELENLQNKPTFMERLAKKFNDTLSWKKTREGERPQPITREEAEKAKKFFDEADKAKKLDELYPEDPGER